MSELKRGNKTQEQILSQVASNVESLLKGVVELGDKESNLASDIKINIQNVLDCIEKGNVGVSTLLNEVLQKLSQSEIVRLDMFDKINTSLSTIKESIGKLSQSLDEKSALIESSICKVSESHSDFSKRYAENESFHQEFENKTSSQIEDINKSMEKIQVTLDIIVNLVTPFWKKWKQN